MTVDNKTKKMTVTKDGKVIRTIPVSLGKPTTPSSSGTMIVIEKLRKTVFDTHRRARTRPTATAPTSTTPSGSPGAASSSTPRRGPRAQQGTYQRVARLREHVDGRRRQWLFDQTTIGDPITVKGTERKLQNGNGWTDWNMSWDEYIKGSAIPYEPPAPPAERPRPTGDPSATPTA